MPQFGVEFAKRLYTAVGANNNRIRIFTAEKGGSDTHRVPGVNDVAGRRADHP